MVTVFNAMCVSFVAKWYHVTKLVQKFYFEEAYFQEEG